jgi:hypothetical protein
MEGQDGLRKEVAVPVRIWWFCSGKHMNCYIRSLLLFFVEVIVFIQFYYCREVTHLFTTELIHMDCGEHIQFALVNITGSFWAQIQC